MTLSTACACEACFPRSRYTGKERDAESGNDYFGARYYSSAIGHFLSPDPKLMTARHLTVSVRRFHLDGPQCMPER
jgi:hypothetical protein